MINGSCGEGLESVAFHQFTDPSCPGAAGSCDYEWLDPSELQDYVDREMIAALDPGVGHGTGELRGLRGESWRDVSFDEVPLQFAGLINEPGIRVAPTPLAEVREVVRSAQDRKAADEAFRNRRRPVRRKARPKKSERRRR